MLSPGGLAVIALFWVVVMAFTRGVGVLGLIVVVIAAGVVGLGGSVAGPARTVLTSVAPALNAVGGAGG